MAEFHYNSKLENNSETTMSKLSKFLYALVMMGAAGLILILFEGLITLNIYFVYSIVGIILGLSTILIIQLFSKDSNS